MGRSHPVKQSPDRPSSQTSSGITEHRPNIFRAYPGISGHFRAFPDTRWSSCAVSSLAGSRAVRPVACRIARRRIACDPARRVRYRPSPDMASGKVVACGIASRRIACRTIRRPSASRHVSARVGDLGVSAVVTVRRAEHPSPAMSRPNSACSRRRYRRFTNVYSFAWPSRFMVAPSAARLRRTVGPLASRNAAAGETRQKERSGARHHRKPGISGHIRAYSGHIPGIFRAYSDTK